MPAQASMPQAPSVPAVSSAFALGGGQASPQTSAASPQSATADPAHTQDLASLIPAEAFMALVWNHPAELYEKRNSSAWLKVLMDPRWADALTIASDEMDEIMRVLQVTEKVMQGASEAVMWLHIEETGFIGEFLFMGCVRGNATALDALVEVWGEGVEETSEGLTVLKTDWGVLHRGAGECSFAFTDRPDLGVQGLIELQSHRAAGADYKGLFASSSVANDRTSADFEFVMNLGWMWEEVIDESSEEMPEFVADELSAIDWIYASLSFGEGQDLESTMTVPMLEGGLLASILDTIQGPSTSDYERIPKSAVNASAGSVDLVGIIDAIIAAVEEFEPDAQAIYEQGLANFGDMLGVDLESDLIEQFSGPFLSFSSSSSELPTMGGIPITSSMTTILDVDRPEAVTQALSALVQFVESSFLGEGFLNTEEQSWGKSWSFDLDAGSAIMMAVDSRSVILTTEPGALGEYHALQAEPNPENSILADTGVKKVLAAFDEVPMAFMSVPAYVETMSTMMDMLFEFDEFEEDPDLEEITDFVSTAEEILMEHLKGWLGYTLDTTANRMHVVLKSR